MIENESNKVLKSIKIPRSVHRNIKAESNETGETIETVATRILNTYFAIANTGDSHITGKGLERNTKPLEPAHSDTVDSIQIASEDGQWIEKLLQVRRSQKPGLRQALENNLHEFVWADEAYNELARHKSPLVSRESAGPRVRRSAPRKLSATIGAGEHDSGDRGRKTRFSDRIDALEEADAKRATGEKKPHGKVG